MKLIYLNPLIKKLFLVSFFTLTLTAGLTAQEDWLPHCDPSPVDPQATENVKRLKKYFCDIYGTKCIAGQMDLTWDDSIDMKERVFKDTGKYPALMGYDFLNYTLPNGGGRKQTEEAIDWWNKGGIVAFMWHWRDPSIWRGYPDFYIEHCDFRIPYDEDTDSLIPGTSLNNINKAFDIVVKELTKLQDADVPVLWRPMHEAAGSDYGPWFWWGNSGAKAYKCLYRYMYKYFQDKGLHNLLWVWNGQSEDFYPGDEYVDIIGWDVYDKTYKSQLNTYNRCWYCSDDPDNNPKLVALTENGNIPSPDEMQEDLAWWLYFMTWNDTATPGTYKDNFWTGEAHNTQKHKEEVYNSDYIITLDELPDLKNYPLD